MLSFVLPVCVFQLCWLCSFVASTIAAADFSLQGVMATSRGRCRPATANQEGEEEREADSKNQEVVETGRGD